MNLFQCINGCANLTENGGESGKRSTWYWGKKVYWWLDWLRDFIFSPAILTCQWQVLSHCGTIIFSTINFWSVCSRNKSPRGFNLPSYSNLVQDTGLRIFLIWLLFNHCMQTDKSRLTILISQYIGTKLDFSSLWALWLSWLHIQIFLINTHEKLETNSREWVIQSSNNDTVLLSIYVIVKIKAVPSPTFYWNYNEPWDPDPSVIQAGTKSDTHCLPFMPSIQHSFAWK